MKRDNDAMFDDLISGLEDMVKDINHEVMKKTIELTPSKSLTNAPYSEDVAHNQWRATDKPSPKNTLTQEDVNNNTESLSSPNATESYKSAKENILDIELTDNHTIYNRVPYSNDIEVDHGMVSKTDAAFPNIARKHFQKYKDSH